MFKTLLIAVVVVILGILAFAATRSDSFSVQRSTTIRAPADKVFALINDFHRWGEWSPWEKLDPALQRTFSGPAAGPGTVYEWTGNNKVGAGPRMTHSTSVLSPLGVSVNSAMLWPSKGLMKSSLISTLAAGSAFRTSMRPAPTLLLPVHS